jgi:hypothetical protein
VFESSGVPAVPDSDAPVYKKIRKLFLKLPGMFVQSAQKSATSHRLEAHKAIAGRPSRIICPGDQHSTTHAASQFLRLVPEHCPYLLSNGLTEV